MGQTSNERQFTIGDWQKGAGQPYEVLDVDIEADAYSGKTEIIKCIKTKKLS